MVYAASVAVTSGAKCWGCARWVHAACLGHDALPCGPWVCRACSDQFREQGVRDVLLDPHVLCAVVDRELPSGWSWSE